jgi:hypothetical protein
VEFPGWVNDITPFLRSAWVVVSHPTAKACHEFCSKLQPVGGQLSPVMSPDVEKLSGREKAGFLVPVMDSEALARAIQLSIASAETCEQMGLAGRNGLRKIFLLRPSLKQQKRYTSANTLTRSTHANLSGSFIGNAGDRCNRLAGNSDCQSGGLIDMPGAAPHKKHANSHSTGG